jgi:Cytochrome C oxidase subunit II, periplasmic domain
MPGIWVFTVNEIRVPWGFRVKLAATSHDVIHGFSLHGVNIHLMLLPGRVARAATQLDRPGEPEAVVSPAPGGGPTRIAAMAYRGAWLSAGSCSGPGACSAFSCKQPQRRSIW